MIYDLFDCYMHAHATHQAYPVISVRVFHDVLLAMSGTPAKVQHKVGAWDCQCQSTVIKGSLSDFTVTKVTKGSLYSFGYSCALYMRMLDCLVDWEHRHVEDQSTRPPWFTRRHRSPRRRLVHLAELQLGTGQERYTMLHHGFSNSTGLHDRVFSSPCHYTNDDEAEVSHGGVSTPPHVAPGQLSRRSG